MNVSISASRPSTSLLIILGLVVLGLTTLTRLPFLQNILVGEEGSFAYLVVGKSPVVHGLDALLVGRIDGVDRLIFPEHNILMYHFIDTVGRFAGSAFALCDDGSQSCTTMQARLPFLLLFLSALAIGIVGLRRWFIHDRPLLLATQFLLLIYIASCPLLVGGSIQPQIDGSLGVLILNMSAAFLLSAGPQSKRPSLHLLFLSGFVTAAGKEEWALCLLGTLAVFLLLAGLVTFKIDKGRYDNIREAIRFIAPVSAGVLLGQGLVYLYAPDAYLAGLSVMHRVNAMGLSVTGQLARTWNLSYPVFLMCTVVLIVIALRLLHYCVHRPGVVIIAGWAASIILGYTYSGFSGDGLQRYYCPAGILATTVLICLLQDLREHRFAVAVLTVSLLGGICLNVASLYSSYERGVSIASSPGLPLERVRRHYARLADEYRGDPILDWSPIGVYYPRLDWVAADLGAEGALRFVKDLKPKSDVKFQQVPW